MMVDILSAKAVRERLSCSDRRVLPQGLAAAPASRREAELVDPEDRQAASAMRFRQQAPTATA
jgi:hypothetical protein